jgi:hypothetical protein
MNRTKKLRQGIGSADNWSCDRVTSHTVERRTDGRPRPSFGSSAAGQGRPALHLQSWVHSGKHHTVTVLGIERLHVNGDFERMSSTA